MSQLTKKLESNIPKMYCLTFIRWFLLIIPVLVLFYRNEIGMTQGQVIIVQVYFTTIVLLTEIPSGYFADKFGYKTSIVISHILYFLAILTYCFAQEFWHILAVETLLGLGLVFKSGADSALMYDTHVDLQKTDQYHKVEGKNQAAFSIAEGLASIIGGLIATYLTLRAPLYFQAIVAFIGIPIALTLTEPKRHVFEDPTANWQNIKSAAKFALVQNANLRWVILIKMVLDFGGFFMIWFIQPYWEMAGVPLSLFGILWALLQFNIAFWAILSHKLKEENLAKVLLASIAIQCIAYIFLSLSISIIGILMIFTFGAIRGLIKPIYINYINHRTMSHMRATVLSVESMVSSLGFATLAPFIGYSADLYSMQTAFLISAGTVAVLGITFLALFAKTKTKSKA